MDQKTKIPVDDLVSKLSVDGKPIQNMVYLSGFVGKSENEDNIILYFDALLSKSIEIKKEDIIHVIKLSKTQSPLGGCHLWIKNASELLYGIPYQDPKTQEQASNYFHGNIYNQYAATQSQAQEPFTQVCEQTVPPVCPGDQNADSKKK